MTMLRDLLSDSTSPVDSYSDFVDPRHAPLLRGIIVILLLGSAALIALVLGSSGEQAWRLYPAIGIGVLGLAVWGIHRWQGSIPAVRALVIGGWILATVTAFFGEGVRTPILMIYSVILIFSGWVLGTRTCARLFLASALAVIAMTASQSMGWTVPARPASSGVVVVAHLLILLLSFIMTLYLVRLFRKRYDTERRLGAEIRQHLDTVERRERQQRALLDNFPFMVWLKDAEGRFLAANQALANALGKATPDEIAGKRIQDLVPAELSARQAEEDRLVAAEGKPRISEAFTRVDGHEAWFETYRAPVTHDGRIIGTVGFTSDITERRQTAAELDRHRHHLAALVDERTAALSIAKEAAESASRAKSAFLANMSHELRTPLNAMIGMTALARRRATDPTQIDFLDKADRASRQLLAVIDDVLDISRIEAERLTLDSIEFKLGEVVDDLVAMIDPRAREKGLAFTLDIAPEFSRMLLRGDPMRLGQVLLNLLSNAVKFTATGCIALRVLRLEENAGQVLLRFEVEDTGIGIAAADRQRVFLAFEQADSSLTRKYGGTGLGLSISKRLVGLMGGAIGVTSEPGTGSCFWFTARLEKTGPAATPEVAPSAADWMSECAGAHVLLAEDEPLNRDLAKDLLESFGVRVDLAEDGRQAVERVSQVDYDMVLMDVQMPTMNGIDAARAIRLLKSGATLPIVALTANAFEEDRRRCLDAGMDDYITKPFTQDQLLSAVARWLARKPG
jgi:two-component system sensor histidine kinase/response regulator